MRGERKQKGGGAGQRKERKIKDREREEGGDIGIRKKKWIREKTVNRED